MLTTGHDGRKMPIPQIASVCSGKGRIEAEDLFQRHEQSPRVGRSLGVRIPGVPERGDAVFDGGKMTPGPAGRLVRPAD